MTSIYEMFSPPLRESASRKLDLESHRAFLRKAESPKGGFYGRGGLEDVYYTFFGLLSQRILEVEHNSVERTASFLSGFDYADMPHVYVQLASLGLIGARSQELSSRAKEKILALKSEGGFCRIDEERPSLYDTCLAVLALDELEYDFETAEREMITSYVLLHQTPDGGFSSLIDSRVGATNQTSAALVTLSYLKELDRLDRSAVSRFYGSVRDSGGGYSAVPNVPMPDLLSTYTSCIGIRVMGLSETIERERVLSFIMKLQCPDGGFIGFPCDDLPDTEYTYYGLGLISLISGIDAPAG